RGGCIIRSSFLNEIARAFRNENNTHLLMDEYFANEVKELLPEWKKTVGKAIQNELPVPAFSSALNYYYSLRSANGSANMIQAQRDYFGAHTFERTDKPRGEFYHENWTGHGGDTKSGTYNV
ncbi:MAG: NADP-dependent phosphogluconate dehydrogenase, partial [Bacteroides sp.]|nr:NADP-dependent phosphogluconate dehydrogenase [Bacteroides sp.]